MRHPLLLLAAPAALASAPLTAQQFVHAPGAIPGAVNWTEGLVLADLDLDGDLDLCFAEGEGFAAAGPKRQNVLLVNQLTETGSFAFVDESVARLGVHLSNAKDVTVGDVNGDGWPDLLYSNAYNTDVPFLYVNRGAAQPGFFDLESTARGFTTRLNSAAAQFGDLDDDGDLDVILCHTGPNYLSGPGGEPRLYFNDGTGHFTEDPVAMNAPTKIAAMDVQLTDFDEDWDLDFLCVNRDSNGGVEHYLMLNDGSGHFTDVSALLPGTTPFVYEAEVGDLDGDLDEDLFFLSLVNFQEGPVRNDWVENGGVLGFTAGTPLAGNVDDNEVVLLDYDVDGDYDVVVGSLGPQERAYRNQGGLAFNLNGNLITKISDSTLDATTGDVDGDGDYDLITAQGESNPGQWDNKLYLNGGPPDDRPPVVTALDRPAQAPGWPAVLHARVRDQVRDDGVDYVTSRALVAPLLAPPGNTTLSGNVFTPSVLAIEVGRSVVFQNQNGQAETITSATRPYTFDVPLAQGQAWERVFVAPGTYQIVSTVSGASLSVTVSGTPQVVGGLAMGGLQQRFAIPRQPPTQSGAFAVELFFVDGVGNESVVDNGVVAYPPDVGVGYCGPAVPNSTGRPAVIAGAGSDVVADQDLTLLASDLPPNQFGYFLAAKAPGFVGGSGGSQGNLCLGGTIGRFAADVQSSGPQGVITLEPDLTAIPLLGAVQPGESWYFQAWFRDQNPQPTSNFTDGLRVDFQ